MSELRFPQERRHTHTHTHTHTHKQQDIWQPTRAGLLGRPGVFGTGRPLRHGKTKRNSGSRAAAELSSSEDRDRRRCSNSLSEMARGGSCTFIPDNQDVHESRWWVEDLATSYQTKSQAAVGNQMASAAANLTTSIIRIWCLNYDYVWYRCSLAC